ncbi:MAG: hypothetical protein ACLGHL_02715 [Actinomycetota bacterium]
MIRSNFRGRRRAEKRLRAGLWLLAAAAAFPGAWALLWPRSFFTDFPGLGLAWVVAQPPFNKHLITDVGAFYLGFAVMFAFAAVRMKRTLTVGLLVGWLVFSLPHLIFHLGASDGLSGTDRIVQWAVLGLTVAIPLYLLTSVRKADRHSL